MAETAIERTKRALDLIPYVMERPGITIQELARDFSVSEKQIRADLDLLYVCGLPGYSPLELIDIATDDDYVDIIDPQLLDQPRNLTRREVIALTVALEALAASRNPDDKLQPIIRGLMGKLQSLLEAPVSPPHVLNKGSDPNNVLSTVEDAIKRGQDLDIEYISAKSNTRNHRRISPAEVFVENGEGYLRAWCFNSGAERTFRLDRMMVAAISTKHPTDVIHAGTNSGRSRPDSIHVTLALRGNGREFAERHQSISQVESVHAEETLVSVEIADKNWLLRSLLGYGVSARIIEPAELAADLRDMARETLELYSR